MKGYILALISLCLVVTECADNIALRKSTATSSNWMPIFLKYQSGAGAVDGYVYPTFKTGTKIFMCARTGSRDYKPWFAVDLGGMYSVSTITVFGRKECCQSETSKITIEVIKPQNNPYENWNAMDTGTVTQCHYQEDGVTYLSISCPSNTVGRFVRIRRDGEYLTLCDVQVYSDRQQGSIAFKKETKMSSYWAPYSPKYIGGTGAVDGYIYPSWEAGTNKFTCALTDFGDQNPWWEVDLREVYSVSNIAVYGRNDCGKGVCEYMTSNMTIEVIKYVTSVVSNLVTGIPTRCHYQENGVQYLNISCPSNTIGKVVRIRRAGQLLCLCEVQVYGHRIQEIEPTCTCTGSGDPHYKTFDGQWIHFQGACKYTLTSFKDGKCDFSVEAKHEYRGGSSQVTYLRLVDVRYEGHLYRLHRGRSFHVDDIQKYVPYNSKGVKVYMTGNKLRLDLTVCGVSVEYDGNHLFKVTVPKKMGENLKGICGNCNGVTDDLRTKEGKDVSASLNKFTAIGNSYEIPDDSDLFIPQCTPWYDVHMCTKDLRKKADASLCRMLKPENKDQSIFKKCIEADYSRAQEMYDSCLNDLCAYHNSSEINTIVCDGLESYADQCAYLGISVQWRSKYICPRSCPVNAEYNPKMSDCPSTCVDHKAQETCERPEVEGCQCKKGYILSHSVCVPEAECGCHYKGEYIPLGKEIESSDCIGVSKCQKGKNGNAELVTVRRQPCGNNAICKPVNGHFQCTCKPGMEGNPLKECSYPYCTCSACGDPHYRTFDGQTIHFQGACKYAVATIHKPNCNFTIEGNHEYRGNNRQVTFMRLIDFKYNGKVYRLHQERNFYVNGIQKFPPYKDNAVNVYITGNKLRLEGPCSTVLEFDGAHHMELTVLKEIGNDLHGLCGNCNGKADDLKTQDGKDVSSDRNKYSLIGNSYEVPDDSDLVLKQCMQAFDVHHCTIEQLETADASYCRLLNPKHKMFSVFKKCIDADEIRALEMYDSCLIDYCSFIDKPYIACETLQGYADQCQYLGIPVHWRDENICPLPCPANSIYKPMISSCPATCTNTHAPQNCKLKPREGCECQQGYVLSNKECVKLDKCGRHTDGGEYVPVGEVIESPECVHVSKCMIVNNKPTLVKEQRPPCGHNAECKPADGHYKCVCKTGTTGNPHKTCNYTCPIGWIYFGLSCYKFSTDEQTWDNAQGKCKDIGAYLAEVESKEETEYLQGLAGPTNKGYWLGGKDDVKEGEWYWANSRHPFKFTNWNTGEPNNRNNEDCVHLWYYSPFKWNDFPCNLRENYICEISAISS